MTRFLCSLLLFVLALPLFAQEAPTRSASTLPSDPALLMRKREQISRDLQNTQRMLGYVNPSDIELVDSLQSKQAELSKQLRDISEQVQAGTQSTQPSGMLRDIRDLHQEIIPPTGRAGIPPMMSQPRDSGWQDLHGLRTVVPYQELLQNRSEMPVPLSPPYNPVLPTYNSPMYGGQNWADQDRALEATPWGPRLPKELTDMKQSVELLQKEVGELKETIKALETQIQLLNRNILLNERVKENGN